MSDSEDDKPLAARAIPVKNPPAAVPNKAASGTDRTGQPSASAAQDPLKRKAAQKAPVVDDSDSQDDKPLGARAKPAKPPRPGSGGTSKQVSEAGGTKAPKQKAVAVKDEPLSPKVKSEPEPSPKAAKSKPRAKKADGEKRVIVKKEYDKPGQTKETPPETDPLHKFYTSLREQRPDSEMAKKWCLIHGLLDMEEAEQLVAQIKLKKGQVRSPAKAAPRKSSTAAASRANATAPRATATAPRATAAAPKPGGKRKSRMMESDDESSEDEFLAPAKKVQKQGSGANAASKPRPGSGGNAQAKPRPPSGGGGSKPSSAGGSRPGSAGEAGKAAAKARPLMASTQRDKAFADGGLDPISDDSDDDKPLGQRRAKAVA